MVFVRIVGRIVDAEAIVALVVVVIGAATRPAVVTLYAEVVVAGSGELAAPCPTLKQSLSQSDGGRNVIALHLLDGNILILVYVLLIGRVPPNLRKSGNRQRNSYDNEEFSHIFANYLCKNNDFSRIICIFAEKYSNL